MAAVLPATASRFIVTLLLVPVLLNLQLEGAQAQLSITAITPQPANGSSPNTFIGATGSQIASSLLASGTPALLWGSIPSDSVNAACTQILNTGSNSLTATVNNSWGGITENLNLQVSMSGRELHINIGQDSLAALFELTVQSNSRQATTEKLAWVVLLNAQDEEPCAVDPKGM